MTLKRRRKAVNTAVQSRYPGIRAFEENEQFLFFGRNEEIRRLHAQLLANTLVVLFAKSGIGKSSLLSAGLVPLLDYDRFQTIKIRFQNIALNPTETVKKALESYLDVKELFKNTQYSPAEAPLWEYIHACRFERYDEQVEPVFIFDQFEEFFEHPVAERQKFVLEIADLVANRLPLRIYDNKTAVAWRTPISVKVIFAIRSDRMSFLHNLGADIPAILQNRFELRPLNRTAAREAIVEPAALSGSALATDPFNYDPAALEVMLDALENRNAEVESFQLQLICQYIEKQIIINPELGQAPVDASIFGGREGIQNILRNYYEDTLAELLPEEQTLAHDFIERGLIVGGRRVGVTEGVEYEVWKIDAELLKKLLDSRLVRAETTHLGKSFEVSHDALVEPIARSFRLRESVRLENLAAEQRQIAEREAARQREIADRERGLKEKAIRAARRARLFSLASLFLFFLTLTIGFISLSNSRDNFLRQGAEKYEDQEYIESRNAYDQVLDNDYFRLTFYDRQKVQTSRDSSARLAGLHQVVVDGDNYYFEEKYWEALYYYRLAQRAGYRFLDDKIRSTERIRSRALEIYMRNGARYEKDLNTPDGERARALSCDNYCLARGLDPESKELQQKLQQLGCNCPK